MSDLNVILSSSVIEKKKVVKNRKNATVKRFLIGAEEYHETYY